MTESPNIDLPIGDPVAAPADLRRPEGRPLEGRYVQLAPISPNVADGLSDCVRGVENDWIWTYLDYGPFDSVAAMRAWVESFVGKDDPLMYVARDAVTGRVVGAGAMLNIVPADLRLEIGHIWYTPAVHGTPIVTEANCLMMSEAFDALGYRRVEWKCDSLNQRSRAAAERLGFAFEGVFRKHMIRKGHNRDTAWYAMTDAYWPRRKANIERWLYDNPDGSLSLREMNRPFVPR